MPIYEYRCDNCSHEFETIQKLSEGPLETCPVCTHDALRKKVSASGFRLKGGGWYETDFKADKRRNVAGDKESSGGEGAKNGADKANADGSSAAGSGDGPASRSGGESGKSGKSSGEGKGTSSEGKDTSSNSKSKPAE